MAGLNFVGNAVYQEVGEGRENIAQFEFIPWILAQCASVEEARKKLDKMNLVGTQFGEQLPAGRSCTGSLRMKRSVSLWNVWWTGCMCMTIRWGC